MSDHGHHDPGGHELEAVNTKLLFRLVVPLTIITFLAAVAVVQWFNSQRREIDALNAIEGSFKLKSYNAKMDGDLNGVDAVAQGIVADPTLLAAPEPPAGWIHPDDLTGGAPSVKPAEKPAEAPAGDKPAEGEPTDEVVPVPVEIPKPDGADAPKDDAKAPKPEAPKPEPKPADAKAPKPEPAADGE